MARFKMNRVIAAKTTAHRFGQRSFLSTIVYHLSRKVQHRPIIRLFDTPIIVILYSTPIYRAVLLACGQQQPGCMYANAYVL